MATALSRSESDTALRAEFERKGYVLKPALFDVAEMRDITAWIDDVQSWPETPGRHWMYFEKTNDDRRILNRIENFVPFHDGLRGLVASDRMLGMTEKLIGESAVLFKDKVNFKLPGGGGFEPHQDVQAGWDCYAKLFVTAMVSIDETTEENGCLEVAEWTHRREMIGKLWKPLTAEETSGIIWRKLPTAPGDAVFFDSFIPHRSEPNPTARPRRVLYITYNPLAEGDQRARYFADKHRSYPQDCEREPGKVYEYKV